MTNKQLDTVLEVVDNKIQELSKTINDNNKHYIQCALQTLRDLKNDLHTSFVQDTNSNYRDHSATMKLVKNNLQQLQDAKDTLESGSKLGGVIGNLIGIANNLKDTLQRPDLKYKTEEIIESYKNDPVIRAYLDGKNEWKDKMRELKRSLKELFDLDSED